MSYGVVCIYFSQTVRESEDRTASCTNYPDSEYESFADCDEAEVLRSLPRDLVPFWATSNLSQATSFWQNNDSNINAKSLYFLMGIPHSQDKMKISILSII